MQVDKNHPPPSNEFLLHLSQEEFGNKLKETKTVNPDYRVIGFVSLKEFSELTAVQKVAMDQLMDQKRSVRDSEGNHYFTITITEILAKIKEFVKEIDPLTDPTIELVGSAVSVILGSDPRFIERFAAQILPCEDLPPLPKQTRTYNDVDIRIKLDGWDKKKRERLSNKLLAFYTEQTKKQSNDFFAHLITTEFLRFKKIDLQKHIQRNIRAYLVDERPPLNKEEIRRIRKLIINSSRISLESIASMYLQIYLSKFYQAFFTALKYSFQNGIPISNPQINGITQNLVRAKIFNKIRNLSDEKPSQYLVHSLGDMEFVCHSKLHRTHITTRDKIRIATPSGKIAPTKVAQSFIDQTVGIVRLDQEVLEGIDFLKLISYCTLGESPALPSDEQRAHESFHQSMVQDEDFLIKFLRNHQSQTPLATLCFIYNCALALERVNKPEDRKLFIEKLRSSLPKDVPSGWGKFLLLVTSGNKFTFSDVNVLLQTLCAINLRRKIPTNCVFEFIIRTDTLEPHFKILLRSQQRNSFLFSPFKPSTSLKRSVELVKNNPAYRNLYCNLYQLILNDTKDVQLQLLALATEYSLTFGTDCLDLWETLLKESVQQQEYPQILLRAHELKLWKLENLDRKELLKHAPSTAIIQKAFQHIQAGKDIGWDILQEHRDKFTEEDAPELDKVFDALCKQPPTARNLGWQLEQFKVIFVDGKFKPSTKARWLLKGIRKTLEISTNMREIYTNNQLANWLALLMGIRGKGPQDIVLISELIREIYSKLRVDPDSTLHTIITTNIPSLLTHLRLLENADQLKALLSECQLRKVTLPATPEILACHLEVCFQQLDKRPIPNETFPHLVAQFPSIFKARTDHKYTKLIDDYLYAIFIKAVENKQFDFIIKFLSQNQNTSIVKICLAYFDTHFLHILPSLLTQESPQSVVDLFKIPGINEISHWPYLLNYTYLNGTEENFIFLVKEFDNKTRSVELTPQNKDHLQECWLTIFDSMRKFKSVKIDNPLAGIEKFSSIFKGNPTLFRAYLEYLFTQKLLDNVLLKIEQHCISQAKLEETPSLERSWILLAATHPTLYKKIYARIMAILDDPKPKEKQVDVDNAVMVVLMSQRFVEKTGMEARKLVYDLYLKIKHLEGVNNLYPSIIDLLGKGENTTLKELACDHFVYHLTKNVFPTNIDESSLLQVLDATLRKPLNDVEPHLNLLRTHTISCAKKSKDFLEAASLLLLHEWNSLMRESDKVETIEKATHFLQKCTDYDPLCLITNEFITLLLLYIKELCKKGLIQEHKQILDAYVKVIIRNQNAYKIVSGDSRFRQFMQVKDERTTYCVIAEPQNRILSLADYRLRLARLYIQCASHSQTTTENSAYFLDAAYDNLLHYIQLDEINLGFYLLFEEFPTYISLGHKLFKIFGEYFVLPIVFICNQKELFTNLPEIPLTIGIRYGLDPLILAVNQPYHRLHYLNQQARAANFESIFSTYFPKMNDPEVRMHVYKCMIPMINYALRENFAIYSSTFETLFPFISGSINSDSEAEKNLSIKVLCAFLDPLITMDKTKKVALAKEYERVCKKCITLLQSCIASSNLDVCLDEIVIDKYLKLFLAVQGFVYQKYDSNYSADTLSFIRILIPVTTEADFITKFEDIILKVVLAHNLVTDDLSKATRAKLALNILKLMNILDKSVNETKLDAHELDEAKKNFNNFLLRFFQHMLANKVFENNIDLLREASLCNAKAILNLHILDLAPPQNTPVD